MKINLGCGGIYKKGYLNLDGYNSNIADKKMSAYDLKIKDNTAEKIIASQLIEHLGIIGSIHCISECFRVLKPQGKLIIETPDIKTAFKKYVNGDYKTQKNLLPWIFGIETPGMTHKLCFPEDLLVEILKDNGFIKIKKELYEIDEFEPVLKIECEKKKNYKPYQLISNVRKTLLKKHIFDLKNQIKSLEIEFLINKFPEKIDKILKKQNIETIEEIIIKSCIRNPEITLVLLDEIIKNKIFNKKQMHKYTKIVSKLVEINFPHILCHILKDTAGFVGEQKRLVQTIETIGKTSIINLLDESKQKSTIVSLKKTKKEPTDINRIDFFSEKMLILKSNRFFQQAAKNFIQKKYDKAEEKFKLSICFNRNQILSYWNLGRIKILKNKKTQAEKYYDEALSIVNKLEIKDKDILKKKIKKEKSSEKIDRPLFYLDEVIVN